MNQREAEQLALRIQREAPDLKVYLTEVGAAAWGVMLVYRSLHMSPGVMKSPSEWDEFKQHLQPPPNGNS